MSDEALMSRVAAWRRIDEVFAWHASHSPDARCASFDTQHWSWAEFDRLITRASQALAAAGVGTGDRVAVLSTPRPEYLLMLMAISRIGAVYVGLNPRYTAVEVTELTSRVRPRLIVALRSFEGQDFLALLAAAAQGAGAMAVPMLCFDDMPSCLAALVSLGAALPAAVDAPDPLTRSHLAKTAAIVFTSGTTGKPKAAMLTHRGLLHAAAVQQLRLGPPDVPARYLCHLPVNHVGCLMNLTLGALIDGGSVVFLQRFSARRVLQLISDEGVNCWLQVPAMYHECVRDPAFDPLALRHLHSICIGGGAASLATLARLRQIGAALFVEYGQTETSSSATYSWPGEPDEVLGHCIGRFDRHFEFRIADVQGQACAAGVAGEIQGRGALVFAGYYGDPEATQAAFTADGWLHTGDLGYQRPDGNIVLKGRLKEMIKSGGYNVYPREIELVLEGHPEVNQVVVVGLPDERYGEAAHAVLSLRGGPLSAADLDTLCRQSLANYKVPKSFRLVAQFPLLSNGKIDRVRTRVMAAELPRID